MFQQYLLNTTHSLITCNSHNDKLIWKCIHFRSSSAEVFCKKGVLKNFEKFTRKHLCQSLFFNKNLQLYWKRDSGAVVFLWILRILKNTFFHRTPPMAASVTYQNLVSIERLCNRFRANSLLLEIWSKHH